MPHNYATTPDTTADADSTADPDACAYADCETGEDAAGNRPYPWLCDECFYLALEDDAANRDYDEAREGY